MLAKSPIINTMGCAVYRQLLNKPHIPKLINMAIHCMRLQQQHMYPEVITFVSEMLLLKVWSVNRTMSLF